MKKTRILLVLLTHVLQRERSSASSFNHQYLLVSWRTSTSSYFRPLYLQ